MQYRILGRSGQTVSSLGLGCMSMSDFYGPADERESLATLDRALELGVNFLDTADAYGPYSNEELIGRAIQGRRDKLFIATKFGVVRSADPKYRGVNGRPEYVRACCEASLKRLRLETIDLYYQHRVDPNTPIEDTVGAMAVLVREGKIRYIGLSEASPRTIRLAHAVHPVAALQTEYSLWTRDVEAEVLPTIRELGIGLVPYSPLGRGFLVGSTNMEEFAEDDIRRRFPRWQQENLDKNLNLTAKVRSLAEQKGCTPAQLALAWLLARGEDVIPIPGTTKRKHLEDNLGALDVALSRKDLSALDAITRPGAASGERYPENMLKLQDR